MRTILLLRPHIYASAKPSCRRTARLDVQQRVLRQRLAGQLLNARHGLGFGDVLHLRPALLEAGVVRVRAQALRWERALASTAAQKQLWPPRIRRQFPNTVLWIGAAGPL